MKESTKDTIWGSAALSPAVLGLVNAGIKSRSVSAGPAAKAAEKAMLKELAEVGVRHSDTRGFSYNRDTKFARYPKSHTYAGIHELGHGTMEQGGRFNKLRRSVRGYRLSPIGGLIATIPSLKKMDKSTRAKVYAAGTALTLPPIAEETVANIKGIAALRKAGAGKKEIAKYLSRVGPGYLSTLAVALAPIAMSEYVSRKRK